MTERTTAAPEHAPADRTGAGPSPLGSLDALDATHAHGPEQPDGNVADGPPAAEPGDTEPGDVEAGDVEAGDAEPGDAEAGDAEAGDVAAGDVADAAPAGGRARHLEREGEAAADFLERLLDIADLDGDIEVDVEGDRAAIAVVDSEEGRVPRRLVGTDGKVLEALQELTRLAVQSATGERSRLMLDVAGYRAERRAVLVELARAAIAEVRSSGESKALDNMSAFERKVVHDEVATAGLASESEGVEPSRHIVILPA